MALPKLNDTPKYDIVIPSTNALVRFRPFLVKEEKVLMMAMESQDSKQILDTVVDTISACVVDDLNRSSLTVFDVEYMFTQIRAKSVGETSTINMSCTECEADNEINVNLGDITIDVPDIETVVPLTDTISIEMKYPSWASLLGDGVNENQSAVDVTFRLIAQCIDAVMTPDERILMRDQSVEEVNEFIEGMTQEQFAKVREFVESMPRMKKDVEYTCSSCQHNNKYTLEGLADFF
jgi:hypothetical protein